jgi:hypothetical protein
MAEKPYLLTYKKNDRTDFGWFESEEEMDEFLDENDIEVIDKVYILQAVNLN